MVIVEKFQVASLLKIGSKGWLFQWSFVKPLERLNFTSLHYDGAGTISHPSNLSVIVIQIEGDA